MQGAAWRYWAWKRPRFGGKRGDGGVVDGEVEIVGADLAFVGEGDARGGVEGHLEVAVESLHGRDGEQGGLVDRSIRRA